MPNNLFNFEIIEELNRFTCCWVEKFICAKMFNFNFRLFEKIFSGHKKLLSA